MAHVWGRITLIVIQLSDTYKCYYSNTTITQKVSRTPVLSSDFLSVKQTVKHIVRIDNVIRMHILGYS